MLSPVHCAIRCYACNMHEITSSDDFEGTVSEHARRCREATAYDQWRAVRKKRSPDPTWYILYERAGSGQA